MVSGVLAVLATTGWIAFIASAAKDRKRVAELDEAKRRLTESLALNHDLSREVARFRQEINLSLRQPLNDIIAARLKRNDAPCSALTHEDFAIVLLLDLCQAWKPWDTYSQKVVDEAREHIAEYRKARNT